MGIINGSKQSRKGNLIQNEGIVGNSKLKSLPPANIMKLSKSICKIETSNNIVGSGFFIKFYKGEEDFFCLMTCEHIITNESIKKKSYKSFL